MTTRLCFVMISVFSSFLQDQGLDVISEGLDVLKNMAHDMNEVSIEMKRSTD